jgi:hypothetical protein
MVTPQIARLLVAPRRVLAEHVARADAQPPRWGAVLGALSAPTAIVAAAIAFGYAGALLAPHFLGSVLLLAASFAIQSFAAALVGVVLYRRRPRATLAPFALTLVAHELFFVGSAATTFVVSGRAALGIGLVLGVGCLAWNLFLTYALFRSFACAPRLRRARALLGVALHFATIGVLVGIYMHAQDLLPYPPGRP